MTGQCKLHVGRRDLVWKKKKGVREKDDIIGRSDQQNNRLAELEPSLTFPPTRVFNNLRIDDVYPISSTHPRKSHTEYFSFAICNLQVRASCIRPIRPAQKNLVPTEIGIRAVDRDPHEAHRRLRNGVSLSVIATSNGMNFCIISEVKNTSVSISTVTGAARISFSRLSES